MKSKYLPLVLIISLLHSCEFIKLKSGEEANVQEIPVARVFDTYLYKADLTGIAPENLSLKNMRSAGALTKRFPSKKYKPITMISLRTFS